MNTFMVTLADREGNDQRVLVTAPATDTEDDIRDYVLRPGITATDGRGISLVDPEVTHVQKLTINRPVRTNFVDLMKAAI